MSVNTEGEAGYSPDELVLTPLEYNRRSIMQGNSCLPFISLTGQWAQTAPEAVSQNRQGGCSE